MPYVAPVTNDAEHKRALTRFRELFGSPRDSDEGAELRALATAIQDYEMANYDFGPTDAADEIEFMLDQGDATLDALYPIFGGRDAFIDFMTRRRELDPETIDALVDRFPTKREWLDKPSCSPEGWQDIAKWDDIPWRKELLRYMPVAA